MVDEIKSFAPGENKMKKYVITDSDGNRTEYSLAEAAAMGINPKNTPEGSKVYTYKDEEGNTRLTKSIADLPMKIKMDTETGDIKLSVPEQIYKSKEFSQAFDKDQLAKYSQAYKLNPEYKIAVTEKNEETGAFEDKEYTIPEYVDKLNDSLESFRDNLKKMFQYRSELYQEFGDKVLNMNLEQIQMSLQYGGDSIYIPKTVLSVGSFGPNGKNPFKEIADKISDDGMISVEDLKKVYTFENIGREEMAGLLATIKGTLSGSDWSKDETITFDDGETVENRNSATEAAKLIAFRNFLLSNNPHAEWWQQAGAQIESFTINAAYGTTRVIGNLANIGQTVVTLGNGMEIQNGIKSMDDAMEYYNTNNAITYDAVTNAQILGMLGGSLLATAGVSAVAEAAAGKVADLGIVSGITATEKAGEALEATGEIANVTDGLIKTALLSKEVAVGAKVMIASLSMAEKASLAVNTALTMISGAETKYFATKFLVDTIHDALLYDSTTLRDVLIAISEDPSNENRQKVLDYWLGQLGENAMWWVPMGFAKASLSSWKKVKTSTKAGQAVDIVVTKYVNKFASTVGRWKTTLSNNAANGNVIKKLEEQLEKAREAGDTSKANHIRNQIRIQNENQNIRAARESLGDLKIEWDGRHVSEKTAKEFRGLLTDIKNSENMIDLWKLGVDAKRSEMLSAQVNPATGRQEFLYPELAGANVKAGNWYLGLVKLNKRFGLGLAKGGSQISQEVIDYWVGSYKLKMMEAFAMSGSKNAADAEKAAETLRKNLAEVSAKLPTEIKDYVNEGIKGQIYQNFYSKLNEHGYSGKYKVLNEDTIKSYENNPIWSENGYMPIKVKTDASGRFISDDDTIDRTITEDIEHFKFRAAEGEHYEDPELVRQMRITHMADAKNSAEIKHLYSTKNNATFVQTVSGEETELAGRISGDVKTLKYEIESEVKGAFSSESNVDTIQITKVKKRKAEKNIIVDSQTTESIVTSMSPDEVSEYMFLKGKTSTPSQKLSDRVTPETFDKWYKRQNDSVRKYLWANKPGGDVDNPYKTLTPKQLEREIKDTEKELRKLNRQPKIEYKSMKRVKDMTKKELKDHKAIQKAIRADNRKLSKSISDAEEKLKKLKEMQETGGITYDDFAKMVANGGDDFDDGLKRAYLIGDVEFASSSFLNDAARNLAEGKEAFAQGVLLSKVKSELKTILNIDSDALADDLYAEINDYIETFVKRINERPGVSDALKTLYGVSDGGEDALRVLALKELMKPNNIDQAEKLLGDRIKKVYKKAGLDSNKNLENIQKNANELLRGSIQSKIDDSALVTKNINSSLGDDKETFKRVQQINEKIAGAKKEVGVTQIMYMDDNGRVAYAKVDPTFASLFSKRYVMEKANAGVLARVNGYMSKAFRYGTTSVNLASWGNQMFRDFGNALLVGGSWRTIRKNADNLTNVFGKDIVEQIKTFEPDDYEMKQIEELAKRTDQTIESAAVSRELMRGQARAPYTTERMLYKKFMKESYGQPDNMLQNMNGKISEFLKKVNPEDLVNGKRENYLRNRVYASSLNDALESGYTLQQARTFAEFSMNNVTTNFSRQVYHLQAIADSTPYFRAAINGYKSFWRVWSVDPVGVTGRIFGGLIIPTMALTGASLMDEEDNKVYSNIPEYTKENSLVFVFNGQPMSIPIPQEMSAIVAPFRQFVEHLHTTNNKDFWELMMNDLLGFAPYDLKGFSSLGFDKMIDDPTIFDRLGRGTSRLFSQMAPVPVKSAYMMATGIDPYTGRSLKNPDYMYWNEETGSVEVMDYNSNAFAKWFASLFGEDVTPELAEKIISGIIGTTGTNLLGDITKALQEGPEAGLTSLGNNMIEQTIKPITVSKYDLVDAVWKRAIKELAAEKDALLDDQEMKIINNQLAQEKDPEKRSKLLASRQTKVDEFQQKVGSMIERLESVYHGNFDRKKFAAVINLLNFNSNVSFQSGSQYSSYLASDTFWDGRDAAVHTMQQLGVRGTNDMSIFGYLTVNEGGEPIVKYSSPVAIMDMESQWGNQSDYHVANIKAMASQNDLWDKHDEMEAKVNAIYNKGNLTKDDYNQIDEIYVKWNEDVMKALSPYISKMTPEAAINNSKVIDYLDSLIEVPGSFKKDRYGKSVSNKKLGNGSANDAYIKNYIRYIYGINNTVYSGGKNYSNRKTYDEENSRWK